MIEGDAQIYAWKCVLSRGIIQAKNYECYDSWYLWWLYDDSDSNNHEISAIVMQFTYEWRDTYCSNKSTEELEIISQDGYDCTLLLKIKTENDHDTAVINRNGNLSEPAVNSHSVAQTIMTEWGLL